MSRPRLLLTLVACALLALPAAAASARVKNGQPVPAGSYEWTVALVYDGTFAAGGQFCGGTLVDATTVVTAAHCVAGMQPGAVAPASNPNGLEVFVNLNDLHLGSVEANFDHYIDVAEIHIIATTDGVDPDSTAPVPRDDVAVLELATPVSPLTAIAPIAPQGTLPADDTRWQVGDNLEVSGWGRIQGDVYPSDTDGLMRRAAIDRLSDSECEAGYAFGTASLFDADDMLCALRGTEPNVVDSCDGDSGGPLTTFAADATDADGRKLVGIVSWGSPECDDEDEGGVYTRVGAPHINGFINGFLDADEGNDPTAQPAWTGGEPELTGTQRVGETVTCTATGNEDFSGGPDEYDLRLRVGFEFEGWTTIERTGYGAGETPGPIEYQLTQAEEGGVLACELYARDTGVGGYGVASFADLATIVEGAPSTGGTTPPPPPPPPPVLPPTVPPIQPPVQPPVVIPRDEGVPRTTRVSRTCRRRVCSLRILTTDSSTAGAFPSGVAALQVRLTSRFRCVKAGGRRRTCIRRRTLGARTTAVPGRFAVTTPRLRRGLHTLRITAIDANGNREPRALTYSFRLRR